MEDCWLRSGSYVILVLSFLCVVRFLLTCVLVEGVYISNQMYTHLFLIEGYFRFGRMQNERSKAMKHIGWVFH